MNDINWIEKAKTASLTIRNFIDGKVSKGGGKSIISKFSPRNGTLLYELPEGALEDVNLAVEVARRSFVEGLWSKSSVQERKKVLTKLADIMEEHSYELALLESLDVGKPISEALAVDVPMAIGTIRYNAEAIDKMYGKTTSPDPRCMTYQTRRPIGVVAAIVGWNFPLGLAAMKVGPALAMGNSLVLKPSEVTSLSARRFAELALEAGLPPGVFNVVNGSGINIGSALSLHNDIDLLSFTGSTQTGKQLMVAAGQSNMKRLLLECGGKSPHIVFDDCDDLDGIADMVVGKAFWNQGEVCTASSRLLIQAGIKAELTQKIITRAQQIKPEDPLLATTRLGPLVSRSHLNKVTDYIEIGKKEGARLCCGGNRVLSETGGYFLEPAIFDEVSADHTIAKEEIFGPVLSVMSFADEHEALAIANSTIFGLDAVVCTKNIGRAQYLARNLDAAMVTIHATPNPSSGPGISTVFGEPQKQSGIGRDFGVEGLESYSVSNSVIAYF